MEPEMSKQKGRAIKILRVDDVLLITHFVRQELNMRTFGKTTITASQRNILAGHAVKLNQTIR